MRRASKGRPLRTGLGAGVLLVPVALAYVAAGRGSPSTVIANGRIAFVVSMPNGSRAAIYTVMPDGSGKRRVTPLRRPADRIEDIDWSPNGRKLVYVWDDFGYPKKPGYQDLFVIGASGGKPRLLAGTFDEERHPTWSPDGRKIAFDRHNDGLWSIWTISPDGTHKRRLTPGFLLSGPAWSGDSRKLACSDREARAYIMNPDGSARRRVSSLSAAQKHTADYFEVLSWSPTRRQLAFISGNDLWLIEPGRGQPQRIYDGALRRLLGDPRWSPDGKQIAFAHNDQGRAGELGRPWIHVINADGTNPRRLADGTDPSWSPDSRAIAFTSTRNGNSEIYVMNADGTNQRNISKSPMTDLSARWSPRG